MMCSVLRRYEEVARLLTGRADAAAEDGASWAGPLCRKLEIPPLRAYGVTEADIPDLVETAASASSMKANPIILTPEELRKVIANSI
jgi:alcohol dehydrogenase class IV